MEEEETPKSQPQISTRSLFIHLVHRIEQIHERLDAIEEAQRVQICTPSPGKMMIVLRFLTEWRAAIMTGIIVAHTWWTTRKEKQ